MKTLVVKNWQRIAEWQKFAIASPLLGRPGCRSAVLLATFGVTESHAGFGVWIAV
jgi:hypothetical protein